MNLRYARTVEQPARASSNQNREKGLCVTVIPCLVVARHGVFSIEEVSTYPSERSVIPGTMNCAVGSAQSRLRGFLMIRKELMCITRSRATGTVKEFMTNSNSSESLLVDSKLPL
jgi:hypothetical protein